MSLVLVSLLSTTAVLLAGAEPLDDAFGVQEGQEVRIVDDGEDAVDFGRDFDQLDNPVDFMLPSTTVVHGSPTKSGPQSRVIGSAMCDLYPRGDVTFPVSETVPPVYDLLTPKILVHLATRRDYLCRRAEREGMRSKMRTAEHVHGLHLSSSHRPPASVLR